MFIGELVLQRIECMPCIISYRFPLSWLKFYNAKADYQFPLLTKIMNAIKVYKYVCQ